MCTSGPRPSGAAHCAPNVWVRKLPAGGSVLTASWGLLFNLSVSACAPRQAESRQAAPCLTSSCCQLACHAGDLGVGAVEGEGVGAVGFNQFAAYCGGLSIAGRPVSLKQEYDKSASLARQLASSASVALLHCIHA
jgi:hypothetical protein